MLGINSSLKLSAKCNATHQELVKLHCPGHKYSNISARWEAGPHRKEISCPQCTIMSHGACQRVCLPIPKLKSSGRYQLIWRNSQVYTYIYKHCHCMHILPIHNWSVFGLYFLTTRFCRYESCTAAISSATWTQRCSRRNPSSIFLIFTSNILVLFLSHPSAYGSSNDC